MTSFCRFFLGFIAAVLLLGAKLPDLDKAKAKAKIEEILRSHVEHKQVDEVVFARAMRNFLEEVDPQKSYLTEEEIVEWLHPKEEALVQYVTQYREGNFVVFFTMYEAMSRAIERRKEWEEIFCSEDLSLCKKAKIDSKEKSWAKDHEELRERWMAKKKLLHETADQLQPDMKELALQRVSKKQAKFHREILHSDPNEKEKGQLAKVVKAFAGALDSHTSYFTPGEAQQFLISVQQRLFGIGVQLRDDVNGFTVVKIVEGGPAAQGSELHVRDRIVAVNGAPVFGMDISDAIDHIRGEENSDVTLTVVRCQNEEDGCKEHQVEIIVPRGEVVLNESRYESTIHPFGDGVIVHLRLHSFYQDVDSSSAEDLTRILQDIRREHRIQGVVLDLRFNSGGMLTQAIAVTGMFIKKGIVVSIKDDEGQVQHLRDLDSRMVWDGPLIVVVNRASASASEIVAQTLQDYGRAIVVGDPTTFGKGSFQTFSLHSGRGNQINPQGEYKVTKGRYYTVSGRTPQLEGVISDIEVPGILAQMEVGEKYGKYPLEGDKLKENFDDDLSDVPFLQRDRVRMLYKFDLQPRLQCYNQHMKILQKNAQQRIEFSNNYQKFLQDIQAKGRGEFEETILYGQNDLQLSESMNIIKDLILLNR